jgi:hypothetical protein
MRIVLKSNFSLGGPFSEGEIVLKEQDMALRNLLGLIGRKSGLHIIDPKNGEVDSTFEIYVNEREYWIQPDSLGYRLRDGDEVDVRLVMFAGG